MSTRKELRLYGDLIYQHKPTIKTILLKFLTDYFVKKNRHRRSAYIDERPLDDVVREQITMPEMAHFAIVKNNIVEEIIVVNQAIADTLRYKKIKFIEFSPTSELVYRGMPFENGKFVDNKEEDEETPNDQKD